MDAKYYSFFCTQKRVKSILIARVFKFASKCALCYPKFVLPLLYPNGGMFGTVVLIEDFKEMWHDVFGHFFLYKVIQNEELRELNLGFKKNWKRGPGHASLASYRSRNVRN